MGVWLATMAGAAYRLVNLEATLQFLGDQGRDAIIAYGILHGDLTLVGPSTSVGSMFLGPLYYYFMAPWLLLAGNNPLGPAVAVVLIGIATIPLLYWVGKRLLGPTPAFLATLLYAYAPVVIMFTRFSWNPNPAPIVTLAMLYAGWRAWRDSAWWWLGVFIGWLVMIQLHYVALLSLVPFVFLGAADVWRSWKAGQTQRLKQIGLVLLSSLGLFLLSCVPLIIFDFRFHHTILKGFADYFAGDPDAKVIPFTERLWMWAREHHGRGMHVLFEIWGAEWTNWYREINTWLLMAYVVLLGWAGWQYRRTKYRFGYWLTIIFLVTSISGLATYRMTVHNHYLTYLFPISYLVTGLVMTTLARSLKKVGVVLAAILFGYISWLAVQPAQLSYMKPMHWQISNMRAVAQRIVAEVPADQTYALASLSEFRDYRGLNYRYFLEISDHPPVALEDFQQADLLVVVAETPRDPNTVLNSPAYEIQQYPRGGYRMVEEKTWPVLYFISNSQSNAPSVTE